MYASEKPDFIVNFLSLGPEGIFKADCLAINVTLNIQDGRQNCSAAAAIHAVGQSSTCIEASLI
eukprot:scaffold136453_cov14-Prasinocladus_malaysianus.AAC.1